MARFHQMVDMRRTPAEKAEQIAEAMVPPTIAAIPDVPYGLRISLSEDELQKLGIDIADPDDTCEVGDMIHLFCMATVTAVSREQTGDGVRERVELSITEMAVENEDREETPG